MSETPERSPHEPAEGEWQHLHPLSPLLRGGLAFVAVVVYVISQRVDSVFGSTPDDPTQGHLGWAALALVGMLVLVVAASWVSWRFSRYRLGATLIELRTGVAFRQHRQVPFDRIQAVDIGRPLLARLTGLSEVVVQSAGGKDSHLKLAFLTDARAQEMREDLIERARISDEGSTGAVLVAAADQHHLGAGEVVASGADAGEQVLTVPNARIVQAILYSGPGAVLLLAVPALVLSISLGHPETIAWLGPMTLAVGTGHLRRLTSESNFTLLHQGDRLRIHHGLTDLRTTTVPIHRIQAIEVSQSLFWRIPGWWRLHINVAGVGQGDDDTQTVLLPVGTLEEALRVVALLRPEVPREVVLAALVGDGTAQGFVTSSVRARPLDLLAWHRHGYTVQAECLLTRRGVLRRSAQLVPHARIQSITTSQGPLQRSRGVATVRLVSTQGPVSPLVEHLDEDEAIRLLNEQVVRSSLARQPA